MAKEKLYLLQYVGGTECESFILRDAKTHEIVHLSPDVEDLSDFLREDVANIKIPTENE